MTPPTTPDDVAGVVANYVRSAARLLDLPLDDAQVARVAVHLARTHAMMALLRDCPLADDVEPVAIFCPAPFPPEDPA